VSSIYDDVDHEEHAQQTAARLAEQAAEAEDQCPRCGTWSPRPLPETDEEILAMLAPCGRPARPDEVPAIRAALPAQVEAALR
jgi:hypothetical protein